MSARRLLCSVDFVEEINRDLDLKQGDNADEQYCWFVNVREEAGASSVA